MQLQFTRAGFSRVFRCSLCAALSTNKTYLKIHYSFFLAKKAHLPLARASHPFITFSSNVCKKGPHSLCVINTSRQLKSNSSYNCSECIACTLCFFLLLTLGFGFGVELKQPPLRMWKNNNNKKKLECACSFTFVCDVHQWTYHAVVILKLAFKITTLETEKTSSLCFSFRLFRGYSAFFTIRSFFWRKSLFWAKFIDCTP